MSLPCSACCVVVLNQQQEQNIAHQNQCQDVKVIAGKSEVKNRTVVENGRVVVKPLQATIDENASEI